MDRPEHMNGALTYEQWAKLEADLFDNTGEALTRVRKCARSRGTQPVPFLLSVIQYVLCCLPSTVCFDAGKGRGCLNLFTVLLGGPGAGKDRMMQIVGDNVRVLSGVTPLKPERLHLGSGEGLVEALQPEEGKEVSRPVLFGSSEVGTLHKLLNRKGSTLRGTLLDIYSGNSLGVTNRGKKLVVPAKSYTAGLWVAAQPDKAHLLLEGDDDGFRHRFVWAEMLDPGALQSPPKHPVNLLAVTVPPSALSGEPITFPDEINRFVWEEAWGMSAYGVSGENSGHRTYTRLKLATGLALLRSEARVNKEDWERAGVLIDYSDKVQAYAMTHARNRSVEAEADKLEAREAAEELRQDRRLKRCAELRLRALEWVDSPNDGQPAASWSELMQSLNGGQKKLLRTIKTEMEEAGAICFMKTETGATLAERGPRFSEVLLAVREGFSHWDSV